MEPFDDENVPLFTVGQVADMLAVKQAFLRRVDQLQVVSPSRSTGGQRRYTRVEIRIIRQVATMADEGMTMPAIRRIIELEQQLAETARERDELVAMVRHLEKMVRDGVTRDRSEEGLDEGSRERPDRR
ncbi:MAG TPA: MerR family transcriptional regulator [Luteitalea sp.]|nr:MerR family transcriptional regulator [Luteitalea sp.]